MEEEERHECKGGGGRRAERMDGEEKEKGRVFCGVKHDIWAFLGGYARAVDGGIACVKRCVCCSGGES